MREKFPVSVSLSLRFMTHDKSNNILQSHCVKGKFHKIIAPFTQDRLHQQK